MYFSIVKIISHKKTLLMVLMHMSNYQCGVMKLNIRRININSLIFISNFYAF